MSRAFTDKIKKNLLFRQIPGSETGKNIFGNIDESVSGAFLLSIFSQLIKAKRNIFVIVPRLDNAEELLRQLSLLLVALLTEAVLRV